MNAKTNAKTLTVLAIVLAASAAQGQAPPVVTIGGEVYSGRGTVFYTLDALGEPVVNRNPVYKGGGAPPLLDTSGAKVVIENMDTGAFVANGAFLAGTNIWSADVPPGGVYLAMYGAPNHDLTSRVLDLSNLVWILDPVNGDHWENTATGLPPVLSVDAYLPALCIDLATGVVDCNTNPAEPLANLLVYAFEEQAVNGGPDIPFDSGLEGVLFELLDADGNVVQCGNPPGPCTGSSLAGSNDPTAITTKDGLVIPGSAVAGHFYFTDIQPGLYRLRATPPATRPDGLPVEWYYTYTMEGGQEWEIILAPGDPGTEAGAFLAWYGFVEKIGQYPVPSPSAGTITGWVEDADVPWEGPQPGEPPEPCCPLIPQINPGVSLNGGVPEAVVVLWHGNGPTSRVYATTEAITPGPGVAPEDVGMFQFVNVRPGTYTLFIFDKPLYYVFGEIQVDVGPSANIVFPRVANEVEGLPLPIVARFGARVHGAVCTADWQVDPLITDWTDPAYGCPPGTGVAGATVNLRGQAGNIMWQRTTDADGRYFIEDLVEIETMAFVDVEPPVGYRGATVTDVYYPNAVVNQDPNCNPATDPNGCILDPGVISYVDRNGMGRYVQWFTANYLVNLKLEPIPAATGQISGRVFDDALATGTWVTDGVYDPYNEGIFEGAVVELWDAAGISPILDPVTLQPVTTATGVYDFADLVANQGKILAQVVPPDEWGGMYSGPILGYYEFRDMPLGDYTVKLRLPASPAIAEPAEPFDDFGLDGVLGVPDVGEGNGLYDLGEPFTDANANGLWDVGELFDDFGPDGVPGVPDAGEGNGVYDLGEPYTDTNLNARWDPVNVLNGYTASTPTSVPVTVTGGARNDVNFGVMRLAPGPGRLEGGIFDDTFLDHRYCSAMAEEKQLLVGLPVVVRDHMGYVLDVFFQPSGVCYPGTSPAPIDPVTGLPIVDCLASPDPVTGLIPICDAPQFGDGVEINRAVAPGPRYYNGNDPLCCDPAALNCPPIVDPILAQCAGTFDPNKMSLELPYTMTQNTTIFEVDWSLAPPLPVDGGGGLLPPMCATGLLAVETPAGGGSWGVQVTVTIEDVIGPLPGAKVLGTFHPGETKECVTNGAGQCNLSVEKVEDPTAGGVTLVIDHVEAPENVFAAYEFDPVNPGRCTDTVTVFHGAPTAAFTIVPAQPVVNQNVQFDGTPSQGDIVDYAWNFGDTITANGSMVQHFYSLAGTYHATLTVRAQNGTTNMTAMDVIVTDPGGPLAPVASFTASPQPQEVNLVVGFDATGSTGTITNYAWDWESDGIVDQNTAAATTSHVWGAAGSYNVTLTVTDANTLTGSVMMPIQIDDPGAPNATTVTTLSGLGTIEEGTKWLAIVELTVEDANGPVAGVNVTYRFTPGETKSRSTDGNGHLLIQSETIENPGIDAIDFDVLNVSAPDYDAGASLTHLTIARP